MKPSLFTGLTFGWVLLVGHLTASEWPRLTQVEAAAEFVVGSAGVSSEGKDTKGVKPNTVYLMKRHEYEEELPYHRAPPTDRWMSLRVPDGKDSTCELVGTDLRYIKKDGTISVNTTNQAAGELLVRGVALVPGPVDCAVEASKPRTYHPSSFGLEEYVFHGHTIYVTVEESGTLVRVIYHQDDERQILLSAPKEEVLNPETTRILAVGDFDRDGKADLWLDLSYGGDTEQDLLFMSANASPGQLLREVARTKVLVF
jgi:hypothetical protein